MIWGRVLELLEGVALGDALRAEATSTLQAAVRERLRDVLGRARIDRAAQDDQRALVRCGASWSTDALEDRHRRVQELVDRRADDDDHHGRAAQRRRVARQRQAPGRQDLREQLVGAVLDERHLAAPMRATVASFVS